MRASPKVALQHYAQVTDADFAKAAGVDTKAAPTGHELGCTAGSGATRPNENGRDIAISAVSSGEPMSLSGLEPETYGLKVRCSTD
jgi:hypothetical protein